MNTITEDQQKFLNSIPGKKLLNMSSKEICGAIWSKKLCASEYCKDCKFDNGGTGYDNKDESPYFEIIHQQIKLKKLGF